MRRANGSADDREAVGAIFEAHRRYVERVAIISGVPTDDVGDVVQNVAIRFLTRPPCTPHVQSWLFRVTRNAAITELRRTKRHYQNRVEAPGVEGPPRDLASNATDQSFAANPHERLEFAEAVARVTEAVERLPRRARATFREILADETGQKQNDPVPVCVSRSAEAKRGRTFRGRQSLRAALGYAMRRR